ncbi:MAG: hypothetical protein NVS1B1_02260 [Candidatus Limnocylindrales bacterium]
MSRTGAEAKPAWSSVPPPVRAAAEAVAGARIVRAARVYGGYAPSATFRLTLANGRRAFLKSTYPLPLKSTVHWSVAEEERVYRTLGPRIARWSPRFLGSFERDGWHAILLEDLGPPTMPPWSAVGTRLAARDYARFHASTLGTRLPRWLSRSEHTEFSAFWEGLVHRGELGRVAGLARRHAAEAEEWLDVALPLFRQAERRLAALRPPFALLHFDTRSDNIRLQGRRLRMFDWPFASGGPAAFDLAAFAQAIAMEGGPVPERVVDWYCEVLSVDGAAIDAALAGICGYFADRAWRPVPAELPRLRSVQRRQLKASLAWAARRFGLSEPRWLAAVAD